MEKIIFFGLVIPIFLFVLYLGGRAIMTGFSAKSSNKSDAEIETNENIDNILNKPKNLTEELNKLDFKESKNKLISNVTAEEIENINMLKDLLIKQIESRVRWRESVINMIKNGTNHFIEIGPGKVLSGLIKRINREVKTNAINSNEDIENLMIWIF